MNKQKAKDELIELLENQVMDLSLMSKIELGDDVIKEIIRLKKIIDDKKISDLIITMSSDQKTILKNHLELQGKINQEEETFSGYSVTLIGLETGPSFLEVEMNSKVDLGEVTWCII